MSRQLLIRLMLEELSEEWKVKSIMMSCSCYCDEKGFGSFGIHTVVGVS